MATITEIKRKSGRVAHSIRFYRGGERKILTLDSDFKRQDAEEVALIITDLLSAEKRGEEVSRRTRLFFECAPRAIVKKFVALGFIEAERETPLEEAVAAYIAEGENKDKPSTIGSKRLYLARFCASVDSSRSVRSFTENEARSYHSRLSAFAPQTVKLIVTRLKAFWAWCVAQDYADANIWANIEVHSASKIPGRDFTVPPEWTAHILDACPSQTWRALFVLWRFGGLRQKEPLALKWTDVNWQRKRLTVTSSKTERFENKGSRVIPLFPEIEEELDALFNCRDDNGVYIFDDVRKGSLPDRLAQIIRNAGLTPWTRLFQNIRATRENELIESGLPAHVVGEWLGHTSSVQSKYYLRVLDSYFDGVLGQDAKPKTKPILLNKP